jgi:vanillate/4-hydroxybenzoate decarboxylase subunit D
LPHTFARPEELHLSVERETVEGSCPECGGETLKRYPVLSEGGWWMVVKCQDCLFSVEREPWGRLGSITLLSDTL